MENKVALITQDGLVANVIVASDEFAQSLGYANVVNITNYQQNCMAGMKYRDGKFLMPPDEKHQDWWYPSLEVTRM